MPSTPNDQWSAADSYLASLFLPPDPALEAALHAAAAANLPAINVSPTQGKFLHLLAKIHHAQSILEIGTLAAYSTIWLARALPPTGRLITLEIDPTHAQIARENLRRANLTHLAEVRLGPALDTLPTLTPLAPFDLIFIDADKPSNPDYFAWALKLSRPGTLILIDNVIRNGAVIDAASTDPSVQGVRKLNDLIAQAQRESRVSATALQTVGAKGYDGFALILVTA